MITPSHFLSISHFSSRLKIVFFFFFGSEICHVQKCSAWLDGLSRIIRMYVYMYDHIYLYMHIRAFYINVTAIEESRICTIRDMPGRHVSIIWFVFARSSRGWSFYISVSILIRRSSRFVFLLLSSYGPYSRPTNKQGDLILNRLRRISSWELVR